MKAMGRGETLAPLNAERWDDGERMRKTAPKHAIRVLRKEGIRSRGMLISHARRAHMLRHFRDGGYRRVLAAIHPENRKASRALEKSPYRDVGRIGWVKIGPLRQDFWHVRHSV